MAVNVSEHENHVDIQDFTIDRKRIPFKIDDDIFEGVAVLGITQLQGLIKSAKNVKNLVDTGDINSVMSIFDEIMTVDSAKRLRERVMSTDDRETIDLQRQLIPILHFLMEKHGVGRPTQPSSV